MADLIVRAGNLVQHRDRTVLRGELDIESSIASVKRDWYQRKANFSAKKTRLLMEAITSGAELPDITLGMRGSRFAISDDAQTIMLHDPVYIIDGLQRWSSGLLVYDLDPQTSIKLGCILYFDTTPEWEQEQFRMLNVRHSSAGANIILRNEKERNRVAGSLYGMSVNEPRFALNNRVCWDQVMVRQKGVDLLPGIALLNVAVFLHRHLLGKISSTAVIERVQAVDQKMEMAGLPLQRMRDNLVLFFDFLDAAWGVRTPGLTMKAAPHLLGGWLVTVAQILSDHREFWRHDDELFVSLPFIRDFKRIDPTDPELRRLAGGNQHTRAILYATLVNLLNKGKSTGRLVDRLTRQKMQEEEEEEAAS